MAAIQASGGRSRSASRRKAVAIHMDMTPMVDLAFLLLTFFMLTTVLMKDNYWLEIVTPLKADEEIEQPLIKDERVIHVLLGENNSVYWYQGLHPVKLERTSFAANGIRKVLLEKKASVKGLFVFIKPSDKSKYQNLVDIFDEMDITNMDHYSMSKPTPEETELLLHQ